MSKPHLLKLTPCRCPSHHRLNRRQLWMVGAVLISMVIVLEGGVALRLYSHGDVAATVMIFTAWMRDVGKEIVKHLLEDI